MNTSQTTQDHDIPSEADKNLYLMLANRRYNKDYLMPNIKAIRAAYSDKTVKGLIDRISDTNMASYNALTNLFQYINKQKEWTESQKETLKARVGTVHGLRCPAVCHAVRKDGRPRRSD